MRSKGSRLGRPVIWPWPHTLPCTGTGTVQVQEQKQGQTKGTAHCNRYFRLQRNKSDMNRYRTRNSKKSWNRTGQKTRNLELETRNYEIVQQQEKLEQEQDKELRTWN